MRPGSAGRASARVDLDEDAVARRYVHLRWPITRLARHYRLTPATIGAILDRAGISRAAPARLDDDAVLAAYARHRSVRYAASVMGTGEAAVRAVLARNGVPVPPHGPNPSVHVPPAARDG